MKYLFIDRKYVQRTDGIKQVFHQPVKEKAPVLKPESPWESDSLLLWNAPIWCDERRRWRMWYSGGPNLPLYAESEDGLNWERPSLGRVSWEGATNNNIINLGFTAQTPKQNHIVLVRDDYETDPTRRFKGLTYFSPELVSLVSADGLDWTLVDGEHIPSGDQFRLGYDEINRRFVATVKLNGGGRKISRRGVRAGSIPCGKRRLHTLELSGSCPLG